MSQLSTLAAGISPRVRIGIAVAGTFLCLIVIVAIVRPDMMDLIHRAMHML